MIRPMTKEELEYVIRINRESPRAIDQTFADLWESFRDEEDKEDSRNESDTDLG